MRAAAPRILANSSPYSKQIMTISKLLLEKEFRETSQNFNSIRQRIEKMEIKIV